MDYIQKQRKDIDSLEVDTVSLAIDELKDESNFTDDLLDSKTIVSCNWYRGVNDSLNKELITHNDKLVFTVPNDSRYSQKNITSITLHIGATTESSLILKNININDKFTIVESEINGTVDVDISLDISEFSQEELNSLISDKGFDISVSFDYDRLSSSLNITDLTLTYECSDKLQSEINVVNNRVNLNSVVDMVYPIGSIYMSINSTNPSTLFGGTWEKIEDRFLLASGTKTVGDTGGSADAVVVTHTHTQESHSHNFDYLSRYDATGSANAGVGEGYGSGNYGTTSATPTIYSTGVDGTDKNMPPYLVVNIWKRTA